MQVIKDFIEIKDMYKGCVLALGTFDGVHLGHREIISAATKYAQKKKLKTVIFSFSNHPFVHLKPAQAPCMLLNNSDKESVIADLGVDLLINVAFDEQLASLAATDFIELLYGYLEPQKIVVGENFNYGKLGAGNIETLARECQSRGIELFVQNLIRIGDLVVSSTNIRDAITTGNMALANLLLARTHFITGTVVQGSQIGRTLGFPTANIELVGNNLAIPANGVYVAKVVLADQQEHIAIANIGTNPTVRNTLNKRLEVHILNFNGDLYGQEIRVYFYEKIRAEHKFNNLQELALQLDKDRYFVREYFAEI